MLKYKNRRTKKDVMFDMRNCIKQNAIKVVSLQSTLLAGGAFLGLLSLGARGAQAETIQFNDVTVTLQSTLEYTMGVRAAPVDSQIAALNSDDGDRNFKSGFMANRVQTLEQLNIQDGNYGIRASAFAWLDAAYLQNNKNTSPNTFNSYGIGSKSFPSATVANEGRRIEPLALFLYGAEEFDNGDQRLSWQLGRQTITWGESFFTQDGISSLQAPADAYEAELLPLPQFQSLLLPTGAARVSYNFASGFTLDGYWQFEYEPDILPGVGSYFSPADLVGPGAQRILATPINEGAVSIYRDRDIRPANGIDQFGVSMHGQLGNFELGAYYLRAIPKAPIVYTNPAKALPTPGAGGGLQVGTYNLVYAKPVDALAMSATTTYHAVNLAAELSGRINQPLASSVTNFTTVTTADPVSYNHSLYAEGDVVNFLLNGLDLTPPLPLMPNGATIVSEVVFNQVVAVTKNKANLTPGNTRGGGTFVLSFEPNWYPMTSLEVLLPISMQTVLFGKSEFDGAEDSGNSTYDIGLQGVYNSNFTFGVNYQRYAGTPARQTNLDRDFATIYFQKTF